MKRTNLTRILLLGTLLAASQAANAISVSWGALATSTVQTCPSILSCDPSASSNDESAGGGMNASANTDVMVPDVGRSIATSTLSGSAFTPELGVFASVSDPLSIVLSNASGIQAYTSSANQMITLDLVLEATTLTPGVGGVIGFVAVYEAAAIELTGTDLSDASVFPDSIETPSWSTSLQLPATDEFMRDTEILNFPVTEGQDFLIWAGLSAGVFAPGEINALGTLSMQLLDPDGNLIPAEQLNPASLSAIPLPAGVWLFLTGVGLVAGLSRRRKTAATT